MSRARPRCGRFLIRLLLTALSLAAPSLHAQDGGNLRLFLDCSGFDCDRDFFRTELGFVAHVRERHDADAHLLITVQGTGGGGSAYTLHLIGQRRLEGVVDTLRVGTPPEATEDGVRRALVRGITLLLARHVAETPAAAGLQITYAEPEGEADARARDPWRRWTFNLRAGGFFDGEASYSNLNLSGSVAANRTTERWKTELVVWSFYNHSRFDVGGGRTVSQIQRGHEAESKVVRSLGPHLSLGVRASAEHSTYLNQDLLLRVAPALEYSLYPYAESTRRQLVAQYSLGANRVDYREETLYGRTAEHLLDHRLLLAVDQKQQWGTVSAALQGSHYLHDASRYRLQATGSMDIRLVRGLSLNVWGRAERIHDQLSIPRGELTQEEILLRQRQLATSFRYFGSLGLSYRFGSIFHGVVNPRLRSEEL